MFPMTAPVDSAVHAWARLVRAHRAALATVEGHLKAARLPPLAWYDALLELERAGEAGLRPFELQQAMLLAQYNLSRLADRLEAAGYIARTASEDDGRGHRLIITPAGLAVRREMWPVYAAAIESAVGARLSDAEARTLGDLLQKLYAPGA